MAYARKTDMTQNKKWIKTCEGSGHTFRPPTTIKRHQQVTCKKRQETTIINHNNNQKSMTKGVL